MPENIKIYKFLFRATIGTFDLNANISSPLVITWKRSINQSILGNETASTEPVEMVSGKAQINQTLTLPVNMYFDLDQQKFQQKKSIFNFAMQTPKGDKQAGVVYVNLATQVNQKKQVLQNTFTLQKCPVKSSQVHISISAECMGEKDQDSMSQSSYVMQGNPSTLSIESHYVEKPKIKEVQNVPTQKIQNKENINVTGKSSANVSSVESQQKDKKIKQLQEKILSLQQQNKKLKSQLITQKQMNKKISSSSGSQGALINSLKEELLKGKSIQDKLYSEIDSYRQQNVQHEKQLETIRQKMDKIYQTFCKQFDIQEL